MLRLNLALTLNSGDTLHVEADNLLELNNALQYLHQVGQIGNVQAGSQQAAPAPQPEPAAQETSDDVAPPVATQDAPAPKPEKPTRTRKPKEEKAEPAKESASADTGEKSASGDKPKATAEDAAAAITAVANKLGLPMARNMLDIFKVKRVGELDPSQYASFIKECGDLIGKDDEPAAEDASTLL